MRLTNYLFTTTKEVPADAIVASHVLMLRAGFIRKLAAGIYNYMPLALRTIKKIENIVREEMDAAGAVELLMPTVQPSSLWEESGRWGYYGPELLRFKDRKGTDYCLGPTHEEVITDIVRNAISSYKDLPVNLYQIQTKFRDEVRPRFGLMRGREFIMKDAYSFDIDKEGALKSYRIMEQAYYNIFRRCGLEFKAVEAGTGTIGGSLSHEFQVLAENGEDAIHSCTECNYAANIEKSACLEPERAKAPKDLPAMEKVSTPGQKTIEEVSAFLKISPQELIKTLIYSADGQLTAVLVRGDYQISDAKLSSILKADELLPASDAQILEISGANAGYLGVAGLKKDIPIYCDYSIKSMASGVMGANENDFHFINVSPERDFPQIKGYFDLRMAEEGETCAKCQKGTYKQYRGIEVGQIFYLGRKYSERMKALVQDGAGEMRTIEMGCYGIGITRTMAAAIEQNHDEDGIIWPFAIAPYQVIICPVGASEEIVNAAEKIYNELLDKKVEVLLDDRNERSGAMFKDADLIGIPLRITVGKKALADNNVELKFRREKDFKHVPLDEIVDFAVRIINKEIN